MLAEIHGAYQSSKGDKQRNHQKHLEGKYTVNIHCTKTE